MEPTASSEYRTYKSNHGLVVLCEKLLYASFATCGISDVLLGGSLHPSIFSPMLYRQYGNDETLFVLH